MGNCDTWYEVDFGEGPVRIRCTQTGNHAQCRTEVFFRTEPTVDVGMNHLDHQNIFDGVETVRDIPTGDHRRPR